jgi:sialate O-acetylesterase
MISRLALLLASLALTAHAELKLPAIIGDNMVLQQKQANPIWGWDAPGTEVTVTFRHSDEVRQGRCEGQMDV